jgi:ankyrin repeat protein
MGAPVNGTGQGGITPLIYAAGNRKKRAMVDLIRLGADPNKYIDGDESAVMLCAESNDPDLLRILMDGGGNPNLRNDRKEPVAFTAAREGNWDNLKLLLQRGADINARAPGGYTITLAVASEDDFEAVFRLLQVGADPMIKNDYGRALSDFVQGSRLRDDSDQGKWKLKVKAFLESKGVKFPVPPPTPAP